MTDLDLLAQKLVFIETCVQELRTLARPAEIQRDVREARFVLHTLQVAIQAALDVASHIVSDERLGERHGGTVQAESPGRGLGATFTVRLPILSAQEAGDAERRAVRDATTAADGSARLDGIRVLLIDDDADGRRMLTILLELAGANVAAAGSVHEALALLDTKRPDVIVSDVGMPDEDGFALIREVRARDVEGGGSVPAIALTGYVRPEDRTRLLAAGFQQHLRKPLEPGEIVAAIAASAAIGRR